MDQGAAPTSGQRFKETITFVHHVFGWNVEKDAVNSRRIAGAAMQATKQLGEIKHSQPFPHFFLRFDEEMACESVDLVLAYFCTLVTELKTVRVRDRRGVALPVCAQVTGRVWVGLGCGLREGQSSAK
eukprot:6169165-Amphidinium_carterae.1